jgi:uncharacterized membrane protein
MVPLVVAAVVAGWIFLAKLKAFNNLGTTSDIFVHYQLATNWLRGRFLDENCFGQNLSMHTYLVDPLLAIFALPFGVPGLILADAVAAGVAVLAAVAILRHFSVPDSLAIGAGALLVASPFSVHMHYDRIYGFHVELLIPTLALCLLYLLLRRRVGLALLTAILLLGIKEEVPILVAVIGAMAILEDMIFEHDRVRLLRRRRPIDIARSPHVMVIIAAVVALPLLLLILRSVPPGPYSLGTFQRLEATHGQHVQNGAALASFVVMNIPAWISYAVSQKWFHMMLWGTTGLIVLRPHLVPLGFCLTVTAWLMNDDLLWAPRFSMLLAFMLCVSVLVIGSSYKFLVRIGALEWLPVKYGLFLLGIGVAALSVEKQYRMVPDTRELYVMSPYCGYTAIEREQADRLFAAYRREAEGNDPVIAYPMLFRYALPKNLYWFNRLHGRPRPVWIIWDGTFDFESSGLKAGEYTIVGQDGRFRLYKRKASLRDNHATDGPAMGHLNVAPGEGHNDRLSSTVP